MSHKVNLTIQQLLDSRAHFGHISRKWNPKMRQFILMKKENLHIVDLRKTLACIQIASQYLFDIASLGKRVLFVGTKEQAKGAVFACATKVSMPYVSERWIGGTLTNFPVLRKLIRKWQSFEKMIASPAYKNLTKKEQLSLTREKDKLSILLGGLGDVSRTPSALIIVDVKREYVAVKEARALGIPIIGIVDTNSDPDLVDIPIPANDDTVSSVELILNELAKAIEEGLKVRSENRQKELLEKADNVEKAEVVVSSSDKNSPKIAKARPFTKKEDQVGKPKVISLDNFESTTKEAKKTKKLEEKPISNSENKSVATNNKTEEGKKKPVLDAAEKIDGNSKTTEGADKIATKSEKVKEATKA